MTLDGRVAIVTGGADGLGKAIAAGLMALGCKVVVADMRAVDPDEPGAPSLSLIVDITDEDAVNTMVSETTARLGRLDALVNNAGSFSELRPCSFEQQSLDDWRRVFEVNVIGLAACCKAAVPAMRRQGGGSIVNIASAAPIKGLPYLLHYTSSKGAVIALTRALAREVGASEITVNAVAPGFTLSSRVSANEAMMEAQGEMAVSGRALRREQVPEDIVGAVTFLVSSAAAFVTGQTLIVDGGSAFS